MDKVKIFKNELSNYLSYKEELIRLATIYGKESKLLSSSDLPKRFGYLREFNKSLDSIEQRYAKVWNQLKADGGVRYDVVHVHISQKERDMHKLDLIEQFDSICLEFQKGLDQAEKTLIDELNRIDNNIKHIDRVLNKMSDGCKDICIDVYCRGLHYDEVIKNNRIFISPSGLYRKIDKEISKNL